MLKPLQTTDIKNELIHTNIATRLHQWSPHIHVSLQVSMRSASQTTLVINQSILSFVHVYEVMNEIVEHKLKLKLK